MNRIEVRYGRELTPADRKKIEAFFRARYGECEFVYLSEPELIGGFVAQIGDEIYDASVSSKLDKLKESIV